MLSAMCMICIDLDRGALRPDEARRALREMRDSLDADHVRQVEEQLDEAESEQTAPFYRIP
jgi:hypothetical protein